MLRREALRRNPRSCLRLSVAERTGMKPHGLSRASVQSDNQPVVSAIARTTGLVPQAEEVFAALARETSALRRFGVRRLALFGSVVRGEAGPESDLDFVS